MAGYFLSKPDRCYNHPMKIEILPVKTRIVNPPKDEIWDIVDQLEVKDGDIVFITSKIMAIHQGRTVKKTDITKEALIEQEADRALSYPNPYDDYNMNLTLTDAHGVLIPAAGIDESNANGYYILWPEDIDEFCRDIRKRLIDKYKLRRLGVVATDSHTTPLRWGVTGITIGLAGVQPLRDIRGEQDLFGREMHVTQVDLIDPLAAMAVKAMGESSEGTPIVIMRGDLGIHFSSKASMENFKIEPELDLYRPLLDAMKIIKKTPHNKAAAKHL